MNSILSISDAVAIGTVIRMAGGCEHVQWTAGGNIAGGTARHIVHDPDSAAFLGPDDDVRDGFLRITTDMGFEHFMPMGEAIERVKTGHLAAC